MKLSEKTKPFNVINKYAGYVGYASFTIEPNKSRTVNPATCSEKFLNALELLHKQGKVDFEFDVESESKSKELDNVEIQGSQAIFNPEKKDRLINVEEIVTDSKPINVGKTEIDRVQESQEFLSQHWKTIERDLPQLSKESVEQHLRVAKQEKMSGKKVDLLEGQLSQLG